MYASVEIASEVGSRIQVPASAIVYTGPRRLVFLDLGQGRFKPQEVHVGAEAAGMYEVLDGIKPGDVVTTSGVFLIAAEARISTAAKYWDNQSIDTADAGVKTPAEAPPTAAMNAPAAAHRPTALPTMPAPPAQSAKAAKPDSYTCPMHPSVKAAGPGKCPICGMDLIPVSNGAKP